jgi:hypothetical protein
MVFRACYRDLLLPIPVNPVHVHDGWIAFILAAVGDVLPISDPLIKYRQQSMQSIGAHPPTGLRMLQNALSNNSRVENMQSHQATIDWFEAMRDRLIEHQDTHPGVARTIRLVDRKIDHLHDRMALPVPRLRRAVFIVRDLASLRYHRYSIGIWAAAKDFTA